MWARSDALGEWREPSLWPSPPSFHPCFSLFIFFVFYCVVHRLLLTFSTSFSTSCSAIFELALAAQDGGCEMDMPELLWKAYIDMELAEGDFDNVRKLYERLLEKTGHFKVTAIRSG